ncbi:MAG: hypothetical protein IJ860_01865 [Eubacterium sp.]|nr:hypothetical protein [Eubacterium sp.]
MHESSDIIGSVLADVAAQLGLPGHETLHLQNESGDSGSPDGEAAAGSQPDNTNPDCEAAAASQAGNNGHYVSVVAGAGDNAAAAVGTGCLHEGQCNLSLGTSGTIFLPCESFRMDPTGATHAFAHAAGNYHLMGCMLSAASCLKWWVEEICESTDYEGLQASINPDNLGKNHVFFLPYLMGERAPLNDPYARGAFAGMRMDTTRAEMTQAVLEGVAFAFRDMAESARALGITINHSTLCGGGAKSDVWKTILANVLNVRLDLLEEEQGPGLGAAMLAARGRGRYASLDEAADQIVKFCGSISPDPELTACYEERYQVFRKIYPAMKELYRAM